ncbi:Transcriptional regulator [Seminavis robusta]|uniref:Transcriptional regulator n=1 Tax=Seminavis robusta TaxID=568900 RepID=A0A9N8E8B5_9STRA|nr:Transcriptional regulator [Seminavis robusta]|eukprot:Sro621_g176700.1 Transcriptional regulator (382) ;mRNA; r:10402-11612
MIRGLPNDVQDVLKIASCFGAEFHSAVLEDLVDFDATSALKIAEKRELIVTSEGRKANCEDDDVRATNGGSFMIRSSKVPILSSQLSSEKRLIWELAFRLGAPLITDEAERYRMAELLLRAGAHASRAAAFDEAASHFDLGIQLLTGRRYWRDEYHLSLALHNRAAEVAYCNGDHEKVEALTSEVIANARRNGDKLDAYSSQMNSLAATNDTKAAFELSLRVLAECGYYSPKRPDRFNIGIGLFKIKRQLKLYTNDDIKKAKGCRQGGTRRDEDHQSRHIFSLYCAPSCCPSITMLGVQLSLEKGLCGASCVPFASLASLLCMYDRDVEMGFRFAQLSLDIVVSTKAFNWQARVFAFVHGNVLAIKGPIVERFAPLMQAHR